MAGRTSTYPMVELSAARAAIADALRALPAEEALASACAGRVLRADARSAVDVPRAPASTKDGFAVASATPGTARARPLALRPDLAAHAGRAGNKPAPPPLAPAQAAYVATGAPLPPGADAVAMVEDAAPAEAGTAVLLRRWPGQGADVRPRGADLRAGEVVASAGAVLRAADAGALAMAGVRTVRVTRRVRVGVLSTGDELATPGDDAPDGAGAAFDANRPMLLALVRALPCAEAVDLGAVGDTLDATRAALARARGSVDVLVSTGGVSMGERDFVKPVLAEIAQVHFGRVNVKPGKPLTFASDGPHWAAVALPGNPVSAFVCFALAALPAIWALAGAPQRAAPAPVQAVLKHDLRPDRVRPEFQRVALEWCNERHTYLATSTGGQASSRLISLRDADALLELPPGAEAIPVGSVLPAHLLPPL